MEPGYSLDSNVIIGYLAGRIPAFGMKFISGIVDKTPHISVISQIEVLRFNDTPENEAILAGFISNSVIHSPSPAVARRTIELCKQSKIKLPDAVIAATALTENFILVTRNTDDFKHISDFELLNPWDIPDT
ncbi:MAG: type II toxin-antitoxin system VapC family toxin [Treponema sp.]|jgi:predicted nucleic acid-binding protein|nr:type II toxin-antitoxin system VapC family toxin [Treponema sp.]